jgi:hypothetical protein
VQRRRSWYGGITALVLLPPGLLQLPPELAGSQGHLAAETAGRPDPDWPGGRAPMVHFPLRHHLVPARRGDARRPGVSGGSAGR